MLEHRDPRTASLQSSIWRDRSEDEFRKQIVDLQKLSHNVPRSPTKNEPSSTVSDKQLFGIEKAVTRAFASLGATFQSADCVCAAIVTGLYSKAGLVVWMACNEGVDPASQKAFKSIGSILQRYSNQG